MHSLTELVITIPEQPVIEMEAAKTFHLQNKIVNPSEERQIITADEGYDAIKTATVEAVQTEEQSVDISENGNYNIKPSEGKYIKKAAVNVDVQPPLEDKTAEPKSSDVEYISEQYGFNKFKVKGVPTEHKSATITENGVTIIERSPDKWIDEVDVTVNVQPPLQEKAVTPSDIQQEITADSPYYGMSKTIVQAVPTEIKRIEITENGETHITRSENKWIEDVTVVADVQPKLQTKRVAASTEDDVIVEPDPDKDGMKKVVIEKVNIQNHKEVTPSSVTQHINPDTGYVGTWDVEVSPIPSESKSIEITENGNTSVIPSTGKWIERIDINVNVPPPTPVEPKDYNFFDWDGTLLYAYSANEINALTELPALPVHEGLTGEWNYTLAQLQSLTQLARPLPANVGCIVKTLNGSTMFEIEIPEGDTKRNIELNLPVSSDNAAAVVNWGDGSTEAVTSANTRLNCSHTYSSSGKYRIYVAFTYGHYELNQSVPLFGVTPRQCGYLRKVVLGTSDLNVGTGTICRTFNNQYNLEVFSFGGVYSSTNNLRIPRNFTSGCSNLKAIHLPVGTAYVNAYALQSNGAYVVTLPIGITEIAFATFTGMSNLHYLTLPNGLTTLTDFPFAASGLEKLIIPDSVTNVSTWLQNTPSLTYVELPTSLTSIPANFMSLIVSVSGEGATIQRLKIPSSVTSIGASAFSRQKGILVFDFSECLAVPKLANVNAFNATNDYAVIIVPDSLYNEWIAATNWATYAAKIVKASEYDG